MPNRRVHWDSDDTLTEANTARNRRAGQARLTLDNLEDVPTAQFNPRTGSYEDSPRGPVRGSDGRLHETPRLMDAYARERERMRQDRERDRVRQDRQRRETELLEVRGAQEGEWEREQRVRARRERRKEDEEESRRRRR
jgi:hypothetical protein